MTNNSEIDKLIFAFIPHEPNLSESELNVLDDIADRVEIQRLCHMHRDYDSESGSVTKSTSSIRTRSNAQSTITLSSNPPYVVRADPSEGGAPPAA